MSLHVVVVGSGSIGMRHAGSVLQLQPQARVSFLRERGRAAASAPLPAPFGLYESLEQAIAARPDLIVIANPSSLHLRYLGAAIDAGIAFYAEKPVVSTRADFLALRGLLDGRALPVNMVGCNLRFLPSLRRLHALLQEGRAGRLVRASLEAGQWLPDWRPQQDYRHSYSASRALGGGVLLDLIHEIDAARWLLGDFDTAHGVSGRFSELDIETEDSAAVLLSRARGPLATIALDYVSRRPVRRYQFVGDRATLSWDLQARRLTLSEAGGVQELGEEGAFSVPSTYLSAMEEMLACVASGAPTSQPISEGMAALNLIFAIRTDH